MIDPASKNQYIQLVTNAQLDVTGTSSLETIYTAPSGRFCLQLLSYFGR